MPMRSFLFVISLVLAAFPPPLRADRVIYYNFEDGTDSTIANTGTGGTNGALVGTGTWQASQSGFGNALYFHPTTAGAARRINTQILPPALGMGAGGAFTTMAWVKPQLLTEDRMVFGQNTTDPDAHHPLHHGLRNGAPYMGHWSMDLGNGDYTVNANQWMHLAWRYRAANGATPAKGEILLNGRVLGGPREVGPISDMAHALLIGHYHAAGWEYGAFHGWIDEVKVFNEALSDAQVQDQMLAFTASGTDTDNDKLPDSWEIANFGNLSRSGSNDTDMDGATNLEEWLAATNPNETNPGLFYKAGTWKVRQLDLDYNPEWYKEVAHSLAKGTGINSESTTRHRTINFIDSPWSNWIFDESDTPFPLYGDLNEHDQFAVEVTGEFYLKSAGSLVFGMAVCEAAALWIDDVMRLNYGGSQKLEDPPLLTTPLSLSSGRHKLRLLMWQRYSGAGLTLFAAKQFGALGTVDRSTVELLQPFDINSAKAGDGDADGLDDFWESFYFGNLSQTGSGNPDGDGLSNAQEATAGSNPTVTDSDSDGLADHVEVNTHATDPTVTDSDGDGLADGHEISYSSNPKNKNSDGDAFDDGYEAKVGTLPNDAASFPRPAPNLKDIGFETLWQLGWDDDSIEEFDGEGQANDNYYFAGNYPGVGNFATDEILKDGGSDSSEGFERAVTNSDPTINIHRVLTAAQAAPGTLFRVTFDFIQVGGEVANPSHDVVFRFNGTQVHAESAIVEERLVSFSFKASQVSAVTGPNVLTLHRTGGTTNSWLPIDFVRFDYRVDTDNDGMANAYETACALSTSTNDAAGNADADGLTNLQEAELGTAANLADSDGDGIRDDYETRTGIYLSLSNTGTDPILPDTDWDGIADGKESGPLPQPFGTNPNQFDTDGDGARDGMECDYGTNALDPASVPNHTPIPFYSHFLKGWIWRVDNIQASWNHGAAIFSDDSNSSNDLFGASVRGGYTGPWDDIEIAIYYASNRVNWLFRVQNELFSQNGDGLWKSNWASSAPDLAPLLGFGGKGSDDRSDRLSFRFKAWQGTEPNSQDKWSLQYEIVNMDTGTPLVRRLYTGFHASDEIHNGTKTWRSTDQLDTPDEMSLTSHGGIKVMFNATPQALPDSDADGLPNAYEIANGLNPNNAADAALDADSDGLKNCDEFVHGSNPQVADTDGDGVNDAKEIQLGYSPTDAASRSPFVTFTPPSNREDLNGDGMQDSWQAIFRANALANSADTDGDGFSNVDEAKAGTNPFDPNSCFWSNTAMSGNALWLQWASANGKRYQAFQNAGLTGTWNTNGLPIIGDGTARQQQVVPDIFAFPQTRYFYRMSVSDTDTDLDGVSDWTERQLGWNDAVANSVRQNDVGPGGATVSGDYAAYVQRFGGDGSEGSSSGPPSREQASRFLTQATFGPTMAEIDRLRQMGYVAWLNDQFQNQAPYLHQPYIEQVYADMIGPRNDSYYAPGGGNVSGKNVTTPFMRAAAQSNDQLRQRIAFALSQILVVSRRDATLTEKARGLSNYYDIFVRNAFGNYNDILQEVTRHPCMGQYLSHAGNRKADPAINRYPDENYARELMQLFTIGLWELNPDGTRKLDASRNPIPTYNNSHITQLARVFTGFWYDNADGWGYGGYEDKDFRVPMRMYHDASNEYHDFADKTLLNSYVIPARTPSVANGQQDVTDAVTHLFNHANTPVFVSKRLIQFLVTSNPNPAYVQRVQSVFVNNGSGVRGDLKAVVRAILLDEEARRPRSDADERSFGKLKEPTLRTMNLARAFNLGRYPNLVWWDYGQYYNETFQEPLNSPSVFNFYGPGFRAPGRITAEGLVSPEFQITNSYTTISVPNEFWSKIVRGFTQPNTEFSLDYSAELGLVNDPPALLDRLNLLLCGGDMKPSTRSLILTQLQRLPAARAHERVWLAVYLTFTSPDAAIQR